MRLSAGASLGAYKILSPLGAGGMGEVFRAYDPKLCREVALKVLPAELAADSDRMSRFEREARLLASLNDPGIAAIYGLEESDGLRAIAMELVEGATLADKIAKGRIPLQETLSLARQMAEALEYAHDKGIVHRDLKPANVKVTPDGKAKLLDFGLAKVLAEVPAPDDSASPTQTITGTRPGVIMGTAAYMAPEQARGAPVDRRADIWSYGVVLYEMMAGKRPFVGATASDTLAAVLTMEPDWQPIPAALRPLLRRCLEKDPKRRLRDIGDAWILIGDAVDPPQVVPSRKTRLPWGIAAAATAGLAVTVSMLLWPHKTDRPFVRLDVDLGRNAVSTELTVVAISLDGSRVVFPFKGSDGRRALATRLLDQSKETLLAGTEGGEEPFFSPDGKWIGFFANDKLQKVSVQGGTPVTLCQAGVARGASWGEDDHIIAALNNRGGLWRVPAAGGTPQLVTNVNPGEISHRWPQVLPGAKAVLFTGNATSLNSYENATIDVQALDTGERKTLWRGGYFGRFLPISATRGYLVYVHQGVLFGVPCDLNRLAIDGTPTPLVEDISSDPTSGAGRFDLSRTGDFVYQTGTGTRSWTVEWLDSSGKSQPLMAKPELYYSPRFSPDGQRLAVGVDSGMGSDIFLYDWQQNRMSRLTFNGATNADPVWTPDGKHIVFRGIAAGKWNIWWTRSDGVGEAQTLLDIDAMAFVGDIGANSFSPDGRCLIYSAGENSTGGDIFTLSLDLTDADRPKPGKPKPFLHTPYTETRPAISPDGRWVSYASNELGRNEVYVRPFSLVSPAAGGKWQISPAGGWKPIWSRNGRELFYVESGRIMVVDYASQGNSFVAGKPRLWSQKRILDVGFTNLDLAPDGKRFAIFPQPEKEPDDSHTVTFLLNFVTDVMRRIPAARK